MTISKPRWLGLLLLVLVAVVYGIVVAVDSETEKFRQESVFFGTRVAVTVMDAPPAAANAAITEVFSHFGDMQRRFYPWREGELQLLNARIAAEELPITLSAPMAAMLRLAKKYAATSRGLFNPAIGKAVSLWGFHLPEKPVQPPPKAEILQWRAPAMEAFVLRENILRSAPKTAVLDFGGLAKGVALDDARAILRQHGVKNALIEVGGSVLAAGKNGGENWRVALYADRSVAPLAVVRLKDGEAVSISGDSERFFIYEGKRYHHIIDPRTGAPATAKQTAIVISNDADSAGAISDAAATALVIADKGETQDIMRAFNITLVWQLGGEFGEYQTGAFKRRLNKQ